MNLSLHLLLTSVIIGWLVPLHIPLVSRADEIPASLRKAWETQVGKSVRVEIKFKGTVTYFEPVLDEDLMPVEIREPLPRAGTLTYDGTKIRFEELGRWPLNESETYRQKLWNDEFSGYVVKLNDRTQATHSKVPVRATSFESCLQPLLWATRPTVSILGQWEPRNLTVTDSSLPKLEGRCYLLAEQSLRRADDRIDWWIHQETATIRQVEFHHGESRTVFNLEYGFKDAPWIPIRWSRVRYLKGGKVESRSDFQIESIRFPNQIDPAVFDLQLEPRMTLVDGTASPLQIFRIDEHGQRVPVNPK